jgi:hypothetical protein
MKLDHFSKWALFGSPAMPDLGPECAPGRTPVDHFEFLESRPNYTGGLTTDSPRPRLRSRRKM